MLVNKKSRPAEEKVKNKSGEVVVKKVKKQKQQSPVKGKLTPDKKKPKKDEAQISKHFQTTQISELFKSKERETARPSHNSKKPLQSSSRIKLLTTSPVLIERSKSKSNSRKKQKSKSRSVSRLNTQRSQQQDKEKQLIKSVQKKLYAQNKENHRDKSNTKSKDKSKSRNKDVSPLRDQRCPREFNVADREVKYMKTEPNELRKTLKKKVQNRMKAEAFFFPTETDPLIAELIEQPKIKLKKKVPQIKTEFSERRGSYFDENLLKKLEINHLQSKKAENCPFSHIRSNFQQKIERVDQYIYSRSEIKTYEESSNHETTSKNRQIQNFKREQEMKWKMMLNQLNSLKHEEQVPQKIDRLIEELNRNYTSLQEKATELFKDTKNNDKPLTNRFINNKDEISFEIRAKNSMDEVEQEEFDRQLAKQAKLAEPNKQINNFIVKQKELEQVEPIKSKIDEINIQVAIPKRRSQEIIKQQQSSQPYKQQSLQQIKVQRKEQPNREQDKNQPIAELVEAEKKQQLQFKRSNPISLNEEFYSFMETRKQSARKEEFGSLISFKGNEIENISIEFIKELDEHKISDKNLLKELNIFENSYEIPNEDVLAFSKQSKVAFLEQMEQIRHLGDEEPIHASFHSEVKMQDEMSSESILLAGADRQEERKKEMLVQQIEQALVLQFCANILRSKTVLHNFLVTYSQLVEQKVINVNSTVPEIRPHQDLSNDYILNLLSRLLNHFEINYQDYFMGQIKIPFECKPIDILRYIRCSEQDSPEQQLSDGNGEMILQLPFFDMAKIQEFETEVLRNQYYIPNYFSFNNCVYDLFNDVFDELRPYGATGKSIFSLQLGHAVKKFSVAKKLMTSRFESILSEKYHEEGLQDEQPQSSEGVFEIVYFTCADVLEEIFMQQCEQIMEVLSRRSNY